MVGAAFLDLESDRQASDVLTGPFLVVSVLYHSYTENHSLEGYIRSVDHTLSILASLLVQGWL
jgi:hypothetical protein